MGWPEQLTKPQRNRLKRYECGWCGQLCHRDSCGAIYSECTEADRRDRAARCLDAGRSETTANHSLWDTLIDAEITP